MRKLVVVLCLLTTLVHADSESHVSWEPWEGAFEKAQAENKLVLLDLEAIWCHWCHVMDETTYRDPEVLERLAQNVVAVKVDQDSRPDLSNLYQEYGWPATIIFDGQGRELARLSGYVNPERMATILDELIANPEPLAADTTSKPARGPGQLDQATIKDLQERHLELYDSERGGWGRIHKFINPDVLEYCLHLSLKGDATNRQMAVQTLDANLVLIDPEWGGVYQYSDSGIWDSPHYEKIMSTQAGNLRVYSLAYSQLRHPRYQRAAQQIADYLLEFWKAPDGGFYTSQDADLIQGRKAKDYFELPDAQRRKLGMPRIDKSRYSRENGMAIEALALYAGVTGEEKYLKAATQAAQWVIANRLLEGGGYCHQRPSKLQYLGDTLYMGKAFLALYRVTADPVWLDLANDCARVIEKKFSAPDTDGYFTSTNKKLRDRQENVELSRFANLLYAYYGHEDYKEMAGRALAYFAIDGVTDYFNAGGVLLADLELNSDATHITVVGSKSNPASQALFQEAAGSPTSHLRLDWWEPGTPLPPHSEVEYPSQGDPAAYLCTGGRCSAPVSLPAELRQYW